MTSPDMLQLIRGIEEDHPDGIAPKVEVLDAATGEGIPPEAASYCIQFLIEEGRLTEPREGHVSTTHIRLLRSEAEEVASLLEQYDVVAEAEYGTGEPEAEAWADRIRERMGHPYPRI